MNTSSRVIFSLTLGLMTSVGALMACGGDDEPAETGKGTGNETGKDGNPATGLSATLQVLPSPAYSGFDGKHKYQIPLRVNNKTGAKWSVNKPELVEIQETAEGVILTTKAAGEVIVSATIGDETGASKLNITSFQPGDYDIGDSRYHAPVSAFPGDGGAPMGMPSADFMLNKDGACTSCHGETAPTLKVQHTPYQTGGYSDTDIITLLSEGKKPAGAVQRSFIPAFYWGMFHQWNVTTEQRTGILSYLRALPPKSQGEFDYPIRPGADGGFVDSNGNPISIPGRDGGARSNSDAGTAAETDAGAADAPDAG